MFTLDYQLDPITATKAKDADMASADSASLHYHLFPGDIVIRGGEGDFSTRWGWVQVLDFALSFKNIAEALQQRRAERFEFTESDAALDFSVEDDEVCISSTYAPGLLRVRASEFHEQVERFVRKVTRDLCEQHPRLAMNPEVAPYLSE